MKITFLLSILFFIVSCSSTPKKYDPNGFENDPRHTEESKKEIREAREREKWNFDKLEKYYQNLKLRPFYFLDELLSRALTEKKWDKVETYANEYLKVAETYKDNWNFGNAIFDSHMALTSLALQKGNKKLAIEHLILASKTPGSPQLDSFGPFNSPLHTAPVLELSKLNEKKALIEFAQNCKKFLSSISPNVKTPEQQALNTKVMKWNLDSMDRFIEQIQINQTPDFKKTL